MPLSRQPTEETLDTLMAAETTSTPAAPAKQRRPHKSLVEDYYRTSTIQSPRKQVRVVLPGVPAYEKNWARDSHDFFNLIVLLPVTILNMLNWNWERLILFTSFQDSWTGDYFYELLGVTVLYFIIDTLWILRVPRAVRSPRIILQHHFAVLVYLMIPVFHPPVRWFMGACLSVEINTWFLIARRVFNRQGFPPWTIRVSWLSIRVKLISVFFYLTWIAIRCILYPILLVECYRAYHQLRGSSSGSAFNILLPAVPLQACFCLLNFKWTYELVMSKLRYVRRKRNTVEDEKGL